MSLRVITIDLPRLADMPSRRYKVRVAFPSALELVDPELRLPQRGQLAMHLDGEVFRPKHDYEYVYCLIVTNPDDWKWPSWLLADWIFCDCDNNWYAADDEPEYMPDLDDWCYERIHTLAALTKLLDFAPPPCENWRESKRRRPKVR